MDEVELLKLLKLVQYTLNSIRNTKIHHEDAEDSYTVASKVDKAVKALEG